MGTRSPGVPVARSGSPYGSDEAGLICAYRFAHDVEPVEVCADAILASLGKGSGFHWLHFNLANGAATKWMERHLDLPEAFWDALEEGTRSTRVEHASGALVAVLNDARYDLVDDASDISPLWLCVRPQGVVSARLRPLRAIERLRTSVRSGETFRSPAELLSHLLRDQADVLVQIVRRAAEGVDRVEDDLLAQRTRTSRARLGGTRRVLVRLQRLLAPEPAALFRLLNRPPVWMDEADQQDLRLSAEEFAEALADAQALAERVKLLQEELAAHVNEASSRVLLMLTVVTVLALPVNLTAGLMGMNVGGVPLAQEEHGFWVVAVLLLGVTGLLGVWASRRLRG